MSGRGRSVAAAAAALFAGLSASGAAHGDAASGIAFEVASPGAGEPLGTAGIAVFAGAGIAFAAIAAALVASHAASRRARASLDAVARAVPEEDGR